MFGTATIYFYCDTQQRSKLQGSNLLASIIKQLLIYLDMVHKSCPVDVQKDISRFFGTKRSEPDFDDLAEIFSSLFSYMPNATYVIDGLDEFNPKEAEKVLRTVQKLFGCKSKSNGSRIVIFSRDEIAPYLSVSRMIPGIAHISTSLANSTNDIQLYIQKVIGDKMCVRELTNDNTLIEGIKQKLLEGASGMFLWVYFQVEALWDTCFTDAEIRQALVNLPEDLEEIYRRCLERIDNRNHYALKVLKWIGCASRPLHVDELKEAVAFDLQDRAWVSDKIPTSETVIGCCANLVVVDAADHRVRFAHSSVKQYLEKIGSTDIIGYPVNPKQGELDCGELCVSCLSFSDFSLQVEKSFETMLPYNTPDLAANLALGTIGAVASKIRGYIALTPDTRSRSINLRIPGRIPGRSSTPMDRKKFKLLEYAVANWAMQIKAITRQSTVWKRFEQLALNSNESRNFQPWIPGGRSQRSHLHGLLGWAVKERHIPLLEIVLNLTSRYGIKDICNLPAIGGSMPLLHVASRLGYNDVLRLLLEICEVNTKDDQGYTALHHAADKGHFEFAMLLANAKGIKVNEPSYDKTTAMWLAAVNEHEHIVSLLIRKGAKSKTRDKVPDQKVTISWAAANGHLLLLKLLIGEGHFTDVLNPIDRRTPLSLAAGEGYAAITEVLLKSGVDVESKDDYGQTPLCWASMNGREAAAKLLLDHGASMTCEDGLGQTPLLIAVKYGHEAVVNLLLKHSAGVD